MSLLVVGSVAYDSVETPFGRAERALGGSGTYFSTSASFFAPVKLVAVVGDDFAQEDWDFLASRGVDLRGVERVAGKTFHWKGRYGYDLNEAHTLETHLNVFETFRPSIPREYAEAPYLFLANIDPELQMQVLSQVSGLRLVACDTMNFWISSKPEALKEVIARVDILVVNEGEVRQITGEANLVKGARKILELGARKLIVKRGEYGVVMFSGGSVFSAPAYPLEEVFDPTGAGDTFAGGFMGFLARAGSADDETVRQAIVFGSVMASFNVESFSLDRLRSLSWSEIEARYRCFSDMTCFRTLPAG